jgi:hypothetical protein
MGSKAPATLLDHPAVVAGTRFGIDPRAPERLRLYAEGWLRRRKLIEPERIRAVMENGDLDRIAHDAAWLRLHATEGLSLIGSMPAKYQTTLRKLWAHAFHAGARHESITVNLRYLRDIEVRHSQKARLEELRKRRKPTITDAKYEAAMKIATSKKDLARKLKVSPQAVRDFLAKRK